LIAKHWIPIWITQFDQGLWCSTTKLCHQERTSVEAFVQNLAEHWKVKSCHFHQEKTAPPFPWCGPSAVNFLEHVALGQPRISDDAALMFHSWKLQAKFQSATHLHDTTSPQLWGQGRENEHAMTQTPEGSLPTRAQLIAPHGHAM
jgi:hypothetical protein